LQPYSSDAETLTMVKCVSFLNSTVQHQHDRQPWITISRHFFKCFVSSTSQTTYSKHPFSTVKKHTIQVFSSSNFRQEAKSLIANSPMFL